MSLIHSEQIPLLDPITSREAIIEPSQRFQKGKVPPAAVACFFHEVTEKLVAEGKLKPLSRLKTEIGWHPIYTVEWMGQRAAVFHPGVGAPLAVAFMEEMIALGAERITACGGAGVLEPNVPVGTVVIPVAAVRDEGTSFHYLPPTREISLPASAVAVMEETLRRNNVPYRLAKTWTTDGLYRETPERIQRRRAEGCLTVEMETSAFFAVAAFRGVRFGQYLYGGDDVSGASWDGRGWDRALSLRERLFWLAVQAALAL